MSFDALSRSRVPLGGADRVAAGDVRRRPHVEAVGRAHRDAERVGDLAGAVDLVVAHQTGQDRQARRHRPTSSRRAAGRWSAGRSRRPSRPSTSCRPSRGRTARRAACCPCRRSACADRRRAPDCRVRRLRSSRAACWPDRESDRTAGRRRRSRRRNRTAPAASADRRRPPRRGCRRSRSAPAMPPKSGCSRRVPPLLMKPMSAADSAATGAGADVLVPPVVGREQRRQRAADRGGRRLAQGGHPGGHDECDGEQSCGSGAHRPSAVANFLPGALRRRQPQNPAHSAAVTVRSPPPG